MQQRYPLKVRPAHKIYKPKSPFMLFHLKKISHPKFTKWILTSRFIITIFLVGQELSAQNQQDSLYNPFTLANTKVTLAPNRCGTGLPARLWPVAAIPLIHKAFADAGIELDKKVWLEEKGMSAYLDGYSHKDKIGFLFFMSGHNMDDSFEIKRPRRSRKNKKPKDKKNKFLLFKKWVKYQNRQRKAEFLKFVADKEGIIKLYQDDSGDATKKYVKQLLTLAPEKESEEIFNAYYLEYLLGMRQASMKKHKKEAQEMYQYIDNRFEASTEKMILLAYLSSITHPQNYNFEYYKVLSKELSKLKQTTSDKAFIKRIATLRYFLAYNGKVGALRRDTTYQALKSNIINTYPLKEWFDHTTPLDDYESKKIISLSEAQRIDENNQTGKQFIALISQQNDVMALAKGYHYVSAEFDDEYMSLHQEYNQKNGMTQEVLAQKRAEMNIIGEKYNWNKVKDLSDQERDALFRIRDEKKALIDAKYKAMETLTEDEKAAFKVRFKEINKQQKAWGIENKRKIKQKTLDKLEAQVKLYIRWAKSQMGE